MAADPMSSQTATAHTIILPIGHYSGAYHPGPGEPLSHHTVRIGRVPVRLRTDDEFGVWALAHGFPGDTGAWPWTREHLLAAAADAGVDGASGLLEGLLADEVLVEVTPGTPDSIEFAQAYRPVGLMFGVGLTQDEPPAAGIGLQGNPAIEVNSYAFELWRFGHRAGSLWNFGLVQGRLLRDEAGAPAAETEPEQMLLHTFRELQPLLASNALYLDTVAVD